MPAVCSQSLLLFRRLAFQLLLAISMVTASVTVTGISSAPAAHAGGRVYVEKRCIIKAMVGPGLKGNGCDLYGMPTWMNTDRRPPFPKWAWNAMVGCGGTAIVPLVSLWWTGAGDMVVIAATCITSAVAANLTKS
jgi:hypothetical protein